MWKQLLLGSVGTGVTRFVNRRSIATAHRLASFASSPEAVRSIQLWKLRRTLRHAARHSAFYRERFRRHGIDVEAITEPGQLGDLFTTAQDLAEQPAQALLCRAPQVIYETTGTTSRRKTFYYSHREVDEATSLMAVGLYHIGVRPADRVLSSQDYHYWNAGSWFAQALTKIGALAACPGGIAPAEVYRRLPDHRYNVLIGDVSWLLRLTEIAEKHGAFPMKLVLGASERLPERSREYIEKIWGTRMYMCYGATEGAGGMECRFTNGYHLNEFSYAFEIVDPDPAGYGEVVFTTLDRTTMPLIRYRIGDVAKLVPETCPCGIVTQRLSKLRGRTDEIVTLVSEGVNPAIFEALMDEIPGVSGNWQVAIRHEQHKDVCELRLELEHGDIDTASRRFEDVLRTRLDTLWKHYQLGLFELRFKEVPRGSMRVERKLRRLVDEREP